MTRAIVVFIVSVICAVIAGGGYALLLARVNSAVADIAGSQGGAVAAEKRAVLAKSAETFMADTASEREELATFVANDRDIVAVIESVEAEARRDKVSATISSVNRDSGNGWEHHELVRVSISAEGSFQALGLFAAALEHLPFASRLSEASIESSSVNSWYGQFTVLVVAAGGSVVQSTP